MTGENVQEDNEAREATHLCFLVFVFFFLYIKMK